MNVLWWHWLSFGLILIGAELFIPSFTIIWFGFGAVVTGLIVYVAQNLSFSSQLFIWTLTSTVFTVLWFRLLKPRMVDKTTAGMSQEAILGEVGMVIKANSAPLEKGKIRFTLPVLGAEEWDFISADTFVPGDYARISGIDGHVLKVDRKQ